MNLNEYRKNAIIQILRLGLTAMAIFALPGILMGLTKPTLFVFSLFAVYPMVCLTPQLAKICSWELTTGTVIDVVLVNDHEQPYTEAHIRYLTEDNQERIVVTPIKEYGPYEKDCEPLLEKMFQTHRFDYLGTTFPVFYSSKDSRKVLRMWKRMESFPEEVDNAT